MCCCFTTTAVLPIQVRVPEGAPMLKWMIEQSGGGMLVTQQVSRGCRTLAPSNGLAICSYSGFLMPLVQAAVIVVASLARTCTYCRALL